MHEDCRKEEKGTIQDYQNKNLQLLFLFCFVLISGMLIVESVSGVISNSALSGNSKIYEIYLTVLTGIHVRCQPRVCIVVFKCLSNIL